MLIRVLQCFGFVLVRAVFQIYSSGEVTAIGSKTTDRSLQDAGLFGRVLW